MTLLSPVGPAFAGELPKFDSDEATHKWLRDTSPFYRTMARRIEARGGLHFRSYNKCPKGIVHYDNGKKVVGLNDSLEGPERVSILIFEITNAYQERKHRQIDAAARSGRITSAAEFGILHELVEFDGLRLHRTVLEEIDGAAGGIPKEMLGWINPKLTTLAGYNLPFAYDFIKAQEAGGHTKHYHKWFAKQVEQGKKLKNKGTREVPGK